MDPEQNPNPSTVTQPAAPATQPAAPPTPAFTQADIDAAREQAKNAAWAEARRTFEGKAKANGGQQQPQQTPQPQQPQSSAAPDPAQVYMRLRAFDRAVDKYGLTDSARSILEDDYKAAGSPDPSEWVAQRAAAFGWKAAGSSNPATPAPETPAAKTTSSGPPVTGHGAPANPTTTITADTPILSMTETDRIALEKRIGNAAYVARFRKELREHNVRVKFGRG